MKYLKIKIKIIFIMIIMYFFFNIIFLNTVSSHILMHFLITAYLKNKFKKLIKADF